jgi:hypothetical protein
MAITLNLTEAQIFQVLGTFLTSVLSPAVKVVRGQQNRVAEPAAADYCVMWPLTQTRLSQNVDAFSDVALIGSISGTVLIVTQMLQGTIAIGMPIDANGIVANTNIIGPAGTGQGGVGTYNVNNTQTLASTTIQAGVKQMMQPVQKMIQVDVHGPNSADNAQIISTLFRDEYGVTQFAGVGAGVGQFIIEVSGIGAFDVTPLYCNDPRQVPYLNAEQQFEERWVVETALQVNPIVSVPQQFAGSVTLQSVTDVS